MKKVNLEVNGKKVSKEVADHTVLSVFLREVLNLTGTHVGCDTVCVHSDTPNAVEIITSIKSALKT